MAWRRGKAYSQDLRDRVLQAAEEQDLAVGQIAERLSVSISYVSKVLSRYRLSGERAARPQRCHVPRKLAPYHDILREQVKGKRCSTALGVSRLFRVDGLSPNAMASIHRYDFEAIR
jgi:transposase